MNFYTTKEISSLWNISERRVTKLCKNNRILGAEKIGGIWLIPISAHKPRDARIKSGKYIKKNINLQGGKESEK